MGVMNGSTPFSVSYRIITDNAGIFDTFQLDLVDLREAQRQVQPMCDINVRRLAALPRKVACCLADSVLPRTRSTHALGAESHARSASAVSSVGVVLIRGWPNQISGRILGIQTSSVLEGTSRLRSVAYKHQD